MRENSVLSQRAIAQLTTGKKALNKEVFTPAQIFAIQRFINRNNKATNSYK